MSMRKTDAGRRKIAGLVRMVREKFPIPAMRKLLQEVLIKLSEEKNLEELSGEFRESMPNFNEEERREGINHVLNFLSDLGFVYETGGVYGLLREGALYLKGKRHKIMIGRGSGCMHHPSCLESDRDGGYQPLQQDFKEVI